MAEGSSFLTLWLWVRLNGDQPSRFCQLIGLEGGRGRGTRLAAYGADLDGLTQAGADFPTYLAVMPSLPVSMAC